MLRWARNAKQKGGPSQLQGELAQARAQQRATSDILKAIASSPSDLRPVFDMIARSATELCEGTNSGVFQLRDGLVHLAGHYNLTPEQLAFAPKVFPAPPHRGIMAGRAILSRAVAHVPDIAADPEYTAEAMVRAGFRSAVSVPMLRNGEPIGAINVTREEARPFSDAQIELLKTFADQAVIAIENAWLINQVQARSRDLQESLQQQTATADVLKIISRSAFDIQAVFDTLTASAVELLGMQSGTICVRDGEMFRYRSAAGAFWTKELWAYLQEHPATPSRNTASGRVILSGRIEQIPDIFDDPDYTLPMQALTNPGATPTALLGVPLIGKDRIEGAMVLSRLKPGPFSRREIEVLQTFADQAVIAIENARLFNQKQEALERQTASADILKVMASSPADVQPVFNALVLTARRLLRREMAAIMLCEDDATFRPVAGAGPEGLIPIRNPPTKIDPEANFPSRAIVSKQNVQIPDWSAIDLPEYERNIRMLYGWNSALYLPMLRGEECIGVMLVGGSKAGAFGEADIALAESFCGQAVIAIENARLFNEVQEALAQQTATADALKVISRSAFDLDAVMDTLASSAADLCKAQMSALYLVEGELLLARGVAHFDPTQVEFLRRTPIRADVSSQPGEALVSRSIRNVADVDQLSLISDASLFRNFAQVLGFRSILMVPLVREGAGIGVFCLGRRQTGAFSQREVDLVQTFADQAVIAIENVRLFNELQQRTRELSQSLDDLRAAQDRLVQTEKLASLGQLTAGIAHEIKNPLNFVNNFAALSAELTDELSDTLAPAPLDQKMRGEVAELTGLLKSNLEKVVQHGKRADSIVKNMLQHSREGSGERRSQDLNALVSESLNLAYHGARAERSDFNITLKQDLDPAAGAAEVYPQELTRALINLISNGFYAAIRRKVEASGDPFEPVLSAATKFAGDAVEIRIRDNGTGIPSDIREKIFNPFFTTKPTGEGTELGLSMAHDIIVKQHGGRIDVETEPGAFTEFIVTLPRGNGRGAA